MHNSPSIQWDELDYGSGDHKSFSFFFLNQVKKNLIFMDMNKLRQYNKKLRGVGINMEGRPVYVEKVVLEWKKCCIYLQMNIEL